MGKEVIHQKDIVINRDKFNKYRKKLGYATVEGFYYALQKKWGLDLSYSGFQSVLYNNSPWKLLYAWAVAKQLKVRLEDLFEETKG